MYAFRPAGNGAPDPHWLEVIERDRSHPCIVVWVPFNESWGVPDLPLIAEQRAAVQAMYSLTRSLDPSRLAMGNDGWEHIAGDMLTIHDYGDEPQEVFSRYADAAAILGTLALGAPGGPRPDLGGVWKPHRASHSQRVRRGLLTARRATIKPAGATVKRPIQQPSWTATRQLMAAVHACRGLSGFCYTQLTDTYQEINGLTDMQRVPKADAAGLAAATLGRRPDPGNPLGYHPRWLGKLPHDAAPLGQGEIA